jgi:D-amino peptidase
VGEIGLVHATAAALGVPVLLLTGDDAACAEMTEWDAGVTTVPVKQARDRFAAELRPVADAREAIEGAAAAALQAASGETASSDIFVPSPAGLRSVGSSGLSSPGRASTARGAAAPDRRALSDEPTLAVRWQSASVASLLLGIPGVTLRDSRTVEVSGTMPDLFRLFGVFLRVAAALTSQPPYC